MYKITVLPIHITYHIMPNPPRFAKCHKNTILGSFVPPPTLSPDWHLLDAACQLCGTRLACARYLPIAWQSFACQLLSDAWQMIVKHLTMEVKGNNSSADEWPSTYSLQQNADDGLYRLMTITFKFSFFPNQVQRTYQASSTQLMSSIKQMAITCGRLAHLKKEAY